MLKDILEKVLSVLDINSLTRYLIESAFSIIAGIIILFLFVLIAYSTKIIINRVCRNFADDQKIVAKLFSQLAKTLLLMIGIITSLGTMGIDISALVAGLGLTGFALGFALKDLLSNILSGVLVILYRPFKINQYIKVAGHTGQVVNVDLRYTTLKQEQSIVLIPNTLIFTKEVVVSNSEL